MDPSAYDDAIVRVDGVHKFFRRGSERRGRAQRRDGRRAGRASFSGLMGPSGSGKTTLLNLIAGLDTPSEGEIWVGDQLISGHVGGAVGRAGARGTSASSSSSTTCCPCLTAYENVELPLLLLPLTRGRSESSR